MDFLPTADWQWEFDQALGLLSVVTKDSSFPLSYKANMLRLDKSQHFSFTIDDVARYIELFESEKLSYFEDALRCKIILHILAIDLFHKPIMPKSWLFSDAEQQPNVKVGDIIRLTASGVPLPANYMLIEHTGKFSLCMLLDDQHPLKNNQCLLQCQLVKVTVNKLQTLITEELATHQSLLNAG